MKKTDKFLVIKLDQYAGNVDEIVCTALSGYGADRYGEWQAKVLFKQKVAPLVEKNYHGEILPLSFNNFHTEYGDLPYELDSENCNNLLLGIRNDSTESSIQEMLSVWKTAYGNGTDDMLEISVLMGDDETVNVKIIGFELIQVYKERTEL